MKRFTMMVAMLLVLTAYTFAQKTTFDKITPELQAELDKRHDADELFRIIIVMSEEYNQIQMSRQIQYMDKAERRAYVIDELQRFSKASQYDLMELLEEGVKASIVKELNPFWIFNGVSCITNREMIASLAKRNDIDYIESDELRNMLPENENPVKVQEQQRELAWHVTQVHANEVWPLGYDGTGIVVAIIDTGVNYDHADVADHMWNGGSQYPHHGYDYVNNDNDPMDDHGHGSHCAGITAGDGTSGIQTGIAPNATIMALKVLNANGTGSNTAITNAEQFAMQHGADVVSMSLGTSGAGGYASERQVFVNMMNAGIIASIAAGNDGEEYGTYAVPTNVGSPGNCPPPWHNPDQTLTGGLSAVVTVGASNRNDRKTTFSSFGPVSWYGVTGYNDYRYQSGNSTNIGLIKPDIIAPGADIVSCDYESNDGYVSMMGTSMATPLVSGIMALMLQANQDLTPAQIDELLETTAWPVDYRIIKNNYTGAGRADALAVIDAIFTQATKPTNLNLETCGGDVNLSWTACTAPAGYCIYRDNVQVSTTTETSYTDENVGTGKHVYYVRANDSNGHQSVHSNAVLCTIEPYATIPENLTIEWDGANAELNWDASAVSNTLASTQLYHTTSYDGTYSFSSSKTLHLGICFMPEDLRYYEGMSINKISYYAPESNISYTIRIYRGTEYGNTTRTAVFSKTHTPSSTGWQTVSLSSPYVINDISQDLWLTICSNSKKVPVNTFTGHNSNTFYIAMSSSISSASNLIWSSFPDGGYHDAISIYAHLTRTTTYTPTYNVYLDNSSEASNLSETNYTDQPTLHSGDNTYYVTAKVGDNESCPSNEAKIVVIDNAQTTNGLTIDESLVYLIEDNGVLTGNGALTCTDPNRLIINDGGQLVNNSPDVQATVKKTITPYTQTQGQNGGWNLIASPITEAIEPTATNGLLTNNYDLYTFDQSEALEWRNYEANPKPFSTIDNKVGYLYANNGNITLTFAGTLAASTESTPLVYDANATFKGFNLIGNPYPCNAYIDRSFYVLNENGDNFIESSNPIAPCSAILVQAQGTDETVAFSKTASKNNPSIVATIKTMQTKGETVIDKARVSFKENDNLTKFTLNQRAAQLYIPQGNRNYAVACANGQSEMPLNFKAVKNGTYTLDFKVEDMEADYLHLIDNKTGADVDLLATPSYTFEATTNDYEARFRLVLSPVSEGADDDNETFAYYANGEIHLVETQDFASLQIVDMMGHTLVSCKGDAINRVSISRLAAGVYVVRLINGEQVKTQKIVVH